MSISRKFLLIVGSTCAIVIFGLLLSHHRQPVGDYPALRSVRPDTWAAPVDQSFNLYRMTPRLYRSALPGGRDLPLLEQLQVKTVVSFIKDNDAEWLGESSIERISIPLHADRVNDADVIRVLHILQDKQADGPVLMHCKHGRDRTGLMAAMYRTVIQGWSKQEALDEMRNGGYGDAQDMDDATRYVENADVEKIRDAFVNGECSTTWLSTCYVRNWLTQ